MERSGYDRRRRPFAELPSENRIKPHDYPETCNFRPTADHFQPPLQHQHLKTTAANTHRGFTTPIQDYRSARAPDTTSSYQGGLVENTRYTPYDVPTSYTAKHTPDDHRTRPRYPPRDHIKINNEPLDKRITPQVSWQYDLPVTQETANQICEKYERPMDPKEFKEQCRKAYLKNAQDRKRNAELSVWGKCDWASFEKCPGGGSRYRR